MSWPIATVWMVAILGAALAMIFEPAGTIGLIVLAAVWLRYNVEKEN